MHKLCGKCGQVKPINEFSKCATRKDGLQTACKPCKRAQANDWRDLNPGKATLTSAAWRAKNPDSVLKASREWRARNPDKVRASFAKWYAEHAEHDCSKRREWNRLNAARAVAITTEWRRRNKGRANAIVSRRRAAMKQALPLWSDPKKVEEFYFAADFLGMVTGEWHHVDHIVPLQSKIVCGLHCEANMQVITGSENQSKSNRCWPDMP